MHPAQSTLLLTSCLFRIIVFKILMPIRKNFIKIGLFAKLFKIYMIYIFIYTKSLNFLKNSNVISPAFRNTCPNLNLCGMFRCTLKRSRFTNSMEGHTSVEFHLNCTIGAHQGDFGSPFPEKKLPMCKPHEKLSISPIL